MHGQGQALPSLTEVLSGNSQSPVDLDSFYAFMRQNYSGVQYLTFWVDAARHMTLCREFVRTNLDSGADANRARYKSGASEDTSYYRGRESPNSSILFDVLQHGVQDSEDERRRTKSTWRDTKSSFRFGDPRAHVPSDLRGSDRSNWRGSDPRSSDPRSSDPRSSDPRGSDPRGSDPYRISDLLSDPNQTGISGNNRSANRSSNHRDSNRDSNRESNVDSNRDSQISANSLNAHRIDTPTRVSMYLSQNQPQEINLQQLQDYQEQLHQEPKFYDANDSETPANPFHNHNNGAESPPLLGHSRAGSQTVTRQDIYNNVDKMVEKYLTPNSPCAIVLPGEMAATIRVAAQGRGKDNPSLFEEARDYVFAALEREAYPAFLNQRALCNVQPDLSIIRLFIGLLSLFAAFWLGFAGILIDWRRPTRCFVIIPFAIGWYLVLSSLYNIDAVLGFLGCSESMQKSHPFLDKIEDPYIKKLMVKRAVFVALITLLVAACFCVLFIFVPGHRL